LNRRRPSTGARLLVAALAAGLGGLACSEGSVERAPPLWSGRPDILVILADDLGCGDPRALNPDSRIPTPNLDAVAAAGMRLTDAHSPSAVCSPTRYGILTGRYAWRSSLKNGVLWGRSPALIEPGRATLASVLKARGYRTHAVGKWHLGFGNAEQTDYDQPLRPGPLEAGFDGFFGIPASLDMPPYVYVRDDRPETPATDVVEGSEMARDGGGGFWRPGPIAANFDFHDVTPRMAAEAERFLEAAAKSEDPFFLYLALPSPHTPWVPLPEFRGTSQAGVYGDFVAEVDWAVGRVLAALERTGRAHRTLLIVTSDNGSHWMPRDIEEFGHRANLGWRGQKADIWEAGHRVPFLARWPGRIEPGSSSAALLCLTDLFATCASAAGVPVQDLPAGAAEDSFDRLPVLLGVDAPRGAPVIHHSLHGMFAIRVGDWKLIEGLGSGGFTPPAVVEPEEGQPPGQLYDLRRDPAETTNLWAERPQIVREMRAALLAIHDAGRSRPAAGAPPR